jgi:predicted protein tyrosine phosphatase
MMAIKLNIAISSLYDAKRRVRAGLFSHVISIADSTEDLRELSDEHEYGNLDHFFVAIFEDVEEAKRAKRPNARFAQREHIQGILNFTQNLTPNDRILIHCHAGISRSPAVALGVHCQHGATPEEAVSKILEVRHSAFPNLLVTTLMDNELGLKGELIMAVEKFRKTHPFANSFGLIV